MSLLTKLANRVIEADIRCADFDHGSLFADGDDVVAYWNRGDVRLQINTRGSFIVGVASDVFWTPDLTEAVLDITMLAMTLAREAGGPIQTEPEPTVESIEELLTARGATRAPEVAQ